jgi:hypothetical protein
MNTEMIKYSDAGDPFAAYAAAMGGQQGKLLKFSKGDYTAAEDDEDVPIGTQFVAILEELTIGWIRWENGKPVDPILGRLVDKFMPPNRDELGYTNKAEWDADAKGNPQDPWAFVNYLPLIRIDNGEAYTFTTRSRGGLNAIGKLSGQFARQRRKHHGQMPIVALEVGSYPHDDYGRIKFPVLRIVDWREHSDEPRQQPAAVKQPIESSFGNAESPSLPSPDDYGNSGPDDDFDFRP